MPHEHSLIRRRLGESFSTHCYLISAIQPWPSVFEIWAIDILTRSARVTWSKHWMSDVYISVTIQSQNKNCVFIPIFNSSMRGLVHSLFKWPFSLIMLVSVNNKEWSLFTKTAGPPRKANSKNESTKQIKNIFSEHLKHTELIRTSQSRDDKKIKQHLMGGKWWWKNDSTRFDKM